jgi:hypothetical protein
MYEKIELHNAIKIVAVLLCYHPIYVGTICAGEGKEVVALKAQRVKILNILQFSLVY